MDGQELIELDKAIEKAENARRKAEDEYALISKFVSDKKYAYDNAKKTYDSVKLQYEQNIAEKNRLSELLEQQYSELDEIKNVISEAEKTSRLADANAQKALLNAQNAGGADVDILNKVENARQRLKKAEAKLSMLREDAAGKEKAAETAEKVLADVKKALKEIQNDRLDELLKLIKKDDAGDYRLLVEYRLLLKGNVSEIKLSEDAENNFIKAVYAEKTNSGEGNASEEITEYFSPAEGDASSVVQKKTAYMKGDAQLILNANGGYCIKIRDRAEKVRTPVIKTNEGYSVTREEKTRMLRDRSDDSEYGVREFIYSYDEKKAVSKVDIINIDGENCNIVEQLTANVDITEKIRENFNISKEAEERKKELEKKGYETTLTQVNSSGYKTYKVTAVTNRQEKMLVAQTRYSHLDVYRPVFEGEDIVISKKDVIAGNDSYQLQKSEYEGKLAAAEEKGRLSKKELNDAETAVKAASDELEKIKSETSDILKEADMAERERQKNAAEAESLQNDSNLAARKLKDYEIKAENIKEETENIKSQLKSVEKDVEAIKAELSKAEAALDTTQKDLEKAENVCLNGKNTFEKADEKLRQLEEEKEAMTHSSPHGKNTGSDRKKGRFSDILSAFSK